MSPAAFAQGGAAPVLEGLRSAAGSYTPGGGGMDFSALRGAIGRMTSGADDPGAYQPGQQYQGAGYEAQRSTTNYTPTKYRPNTPGAMQQDADRNQAINRYTYSTSEKNRNIAQAELGRINAGVPSPPPQGAPSRPPLQDHAAAVQRRFMPYTSYR
jgi:hypothetical protein